MNIMNNSKRLTEALSQAVVSNAPVKRGRLVAVRLSEDEFASIVEYRGRCPMPDAPMSIFLRLLLAQGIGASDKLVTKFPKSSPKKIKHRVSASRESK
jgi:hypothetical protein